MEDNIQNILNEISGKKEKVKTRNYTFFKSQPLIKKKYEDLIKEYCFHNDVIHLTSFFEFDFRSNNSAGLVIMIQFMKSKYIKNKKLKEADDYFIQRITKKGRRPYNDRNNKNSVLNKFYISDKYAKYYIDLLYSYYSDKGKDLNDISLNRGYFFTDFVNYIEKNKKGFLDFKPQKD